MRAVHGLQLGHAVQAPRVAGVGLQRWTRAWAQNVRMNMENLVTMLNDISTFFAGEGDVQQAAAGAESHISRYWEKRMRLQMIEHYRAGGDGLSEISRVAVALLAREGANAPQIHARDEPQGGGDAG